MSGEGKDEKHGSRGGDGVGRLGPGFSAFVTRTLSRNGSEQRNICIHKESSIQQSIITMGLVSLTSALTALGPVSESINHSIRRGESQSRFSGVLRRQSV